MRYAVVIEKAAEMVLPFPNRPARLTTSTSQPNHTPPRDGREVTPTNGLPRPRVGTNNQPTLIAPLSPSHST
jgi:hypothetical protein